MAEAGGFGQQNEGALRAINSEAYRQGDRHDTTEESLLLDPSRGQGEGHVTVAPVARRRAVDASDLRQCALVQTKMKTWKAGLVVVYTVNTIMCFDIVRNVRNVHLRWFSGI